MVVVVMVVVVVVVMMLMMVVVTVVVAVLCYTMRSWSRYRLYFSVCLSALLSVGGLLPYSIVGAPELPNGPLEAAEY